MKGRTASTSVSPSILSISSLLYTRENHHAMFLPLQITSNKSLKKKTVEGLLDSGASGKFIDSNFAREINAETKNLKKPIKVYNVDGTPNKRGTITQYVELELEIHKRKNKHKFLVTGLGSQQIILGFPWLKEMNPLIDWQKGTLEWRKSTSGKQPQETTIEWYTFVQSLLNKEDLKKQTNQPVAITTEKDKEEHLNRTQNPPNQKDAELGQLVSSIMENDVTWINAKGTKATEIQAEIDRKSVV